jgi:hypothetical protein
MIDYVGNLHAAADRMNHLDEAGMKPFVPQTSGGGGVVDAKKLNETIKEMKYELFSKFLMFYLELVKRSTERQTSILIKCANSLLQQCKDNPNVKPVFAKLVDELSILSLIPLHYHGDQFIEFVKATTQDEMNMQRFHRVISFLDTLHHYFTETVITKMQTPFRQLLQREITPVQKECVAIFSAKIEELQHKLPSIAISMLIKDVSKSFLADYHKQKSGELKDALDGEVWKVADIPYSFLQIFNYFAHASSQDGTKPPRGHGQGHAEVVSGNILPVEITGKHGGGGSNVDLDKAGLHSGRGSGYEEGHGGDDDLELELRQKVMEMKARRQNVAQTDHIEVMKNEISFHGAKYRVTDGFLLLIRMINEYLQLNDRYSALSSELAMNILDLMRVKYLLCTV